MSVGSAADDGTQASYDENCSSKLVVTFVSGTEGLSVVSYSALIDRLKYKSR